jgi:ATP-dependent DNA helicase RecQ
MLPQEALKKYFGYDNFRPLQAEIIANILAKKDTFVLMPTGGGKSICFQIPALVENGICVVVSPLIALMKDQVEGLKGNGVAAAYINSSQGTTEQREVENQLQQGKLKLLYVSPEKLTSTGFISFLKTLTINLFAIDEAHCISSWGHDFRPEYTQLKHLKQHFPSTPVMALTATADKITRRDIVTQLALQEPETFIASFDRPNLSLTVKPARNRADRLLYFIKSRPKQSGIVYCLSRKTTESVAEKLREKGIDAQAYHAGMESQARAKVQEDFIKDKTPIICATIAFGMGIDKSNIRWVVHYNMPKNMEGYYQEIGRAGRDGLPSDTLLMYGLDDMIMLREFAQGSGQPELQLSKLERIKQYAEAQICRRKILLSYFGETLTENCNNCDVCKNPPTFFDGTLAAQKALSAIVRTEEKIGTGMLIDILRGSRQQDLIEKGYDKIKTYGVGREYSAYEWQQILLQMLHLGLVEIAYDEGNTLKVNAFSQDVLYKKRTITFVALDKTPFDTRKNAAEQVAKSKPKSESELLTEELLEQLKIARTGLAQQKNIAPYLIFSDASLQDMALKKPLTPLAIQNISGVGAAKYEQYGNIFLETIANFAINKVKQGAKITGSTYLLTHELYKQKLPLADIATQRGIQVGTVGMHLAYLYENGYEIDFQDIISDLEYKMIVKAYQDLQQPEGAKIVFEALGGEIGYEKIRIAIAKFKVLAG